MFRCSCTITMMSLLYCSARALVCMRSMYIYHLCIEGYRWQFPPFHGKPIKMCILGRFSYRKDSKYTDTTKSTVYYCCCCCLCSWISMTSILVNIYWIFKMDDYLIYGYSMKLYTHFPDMKMHSINLLDSN